MVHVRRDGHEAVHDEIFVHGEVKHLDLAVHDLAVFILWVLDEKRALHPNRGIALSEVRVRHAEADVQIIHDRAGV